MIPYKILHRLFGWDYIYWENTADQGIARVLIDGEGNPFYWRYKITKLADSLVPDKTWVRIMWLTCPPSKYLKE